MTEPRSVKAPRKRPQIVAVIASLEDFRRATRLRRLPDLFELRLDALYGTPVDLKNSITHLRAPLIVTARAPSEGGLNGLTVARRKSLLLDALPYAAYVDIEARNVRLLAPVLRAAQDRGVRRIISLHQLQSTPSVNKLLHECLREAEASGADIFKLATRTDTPDELERLLTFFRAAKTLMPVSAMGIGKLGRISRHMLHRAGSTLNYVHLGSARLDGQLSLGEMHRFVDGETAKRR